MQILDMMIKGEITWMQVVSVVEEEEAEVASEAEAEEDEEEVGEDLFTRRAA